jgi:hypothetical protein
MESSKVVSIELESTASLSDDYDFCIDKYPDLPEKIKSYDTSNVDEVNTVLSTESKTITFFIFPNLSNYVTTNFTTLLPWISILVLAALGLLTCCIYSLIACCTKEKFILNDE